MINPKPTIPYQYKNHAQAKKPVEKLYKNAGFP